MAMLAPVHVENFGRLFGSNQPISSHFAAFNSSDQLQRKRSSIFQEALYGRFPRTTLLPLLLSVNHFHAAQLSLAAAAAFGNLCPLRTVIIGSDNHM
jgi:hypothetical protein